MGVGCDAVGVMRRMKDEKKSEVMEGKINDEIKVKIHTYMKSDRAMKEKDKNEDPNQYVICPEYLQLLVPLQICVLLYLMMFGSVVS